MQSAQLISCRTQLNGKNKTTNKQEEPAGQLPGFQCSKNSEELVLQEDPGLGVS